MLRIESFAVTDVGCKRDHNEDYYGIDERYELYVVADGMGGHASGEVASRLAVENLLEFYTRTCRADGFRWPYPPDPKATTFEEIALSNAIQYANDRVFIESMKDRRYDDMGTTLVAVAGAGESMVVAHVGDSRVYRYRNGQITQITEDHSLLNHYIRTRGMTEEEIKAFKSKNVIVRAVGLKDYVEPDVQLSGKTADDIWLLCSDGLSDLVDDWIIQEVIAGNEDDLETIGHSLVRLANQNGGKDNITVMLLRIHGEGEHDRATRRLPDSFAIEELDTSDFLFDEGLSSGDRTQPHPMSLVDTGPIRTASGTTRLPAEEAVAMASQAAPQPAPEPAPMRVGAGQRIGVTVSSGEVEMPDRSQRKAATAAPVASVTVAPAAAPSGHAPEVRMRDTQPVPLVDPATDLSEDEGVEEPPEDATRPSLMAMRNEPQPQPEPEPVAPAPVQVIQVVQPEPAPTGPAPARTRPLTELPDEELAALLADARPAPLPRA